MVFSPVCVLGGIRNDLTGSLYKASTSMFVNVYLNLHFETPPAVPPQLLHNAFL